MANSPYRACKSKGCKAHNKTPPQLPAAQQPVDDKCRLCGAETQWKDGTPGRTGAMAFCAELPRGAAGVRPPGGRVRAARIRGLQSFGLIMKLDPAHGDDPDWPAGTDVRAHFGVTKWEPPVESADGEVEPAHPRFHTYTDIEHLANYPGVIADGEEVIFTEKLHGKNCRVGLVLATADGGAPAWQWMAGSHGQRRKETFPTVRRFQADELVEQLVLTPADVRPGCVFAYDGGKSWRIVDAPPAADDGRQYVRAEEVYKAGDGR